MAKSNSCYNYVTLTYRYLYLTSVSWTITDKRRFISRKNYFVFSLFLLVKDIPLVKPFGQITSKHTG